MKRTFAHRLDLHRHGGGHRARDRGAGRGRQLAPVSNIFLRLIKSIIAPLLFGTLVYGIAGTRRAQTRWDASG